MEATNIDEENILDLIVLRRKIVRTQTNRIIIYFKGPTFLCDNFEFINNKDKLM